MKGIKKCFMLLLSLGWVFLIPRAGASEICNRVVAVVNDEVITLFELNSRIKEMTGVDPEQMKAQDEKRYLEMRRRIIDLLIDEKLAQGKIREQKHRRYGSGGGRGHRADQRRKEIDPRRPVGRAQTDQPDL